MSIDTAHFKEKLKKELGELEAELKTLGRKKPGSPDDWEATPADMNTLHADKNEVADSMEEYEERAGILKELEIQYNEVKDALERIENGTYGVCSSYLEKEGGREDKHEIPLERLEAFPAARACIEHAS